MGATASCDTGADEVMRDLLRGMVMIVWGCSMHPPVHAADDASAYKKDVVLWYEAFNQKDPALLDRVLSASWVDIPAVHGQRPGPEGAKPLLSSLTTAFPDLELTLKDIFQDGNRVIVRAEMSGTQRAPFMGFAAKNRKMSIQVVDIHEFKDGKIVRTWHTEDWLTGLHQLGVFEK